MKILPRTRQTGLVAISMLAVATPLYAQDQSHNLNIGPQSVAGALKILANQTQLQIVSDGSAVQGRQTQGVKGLYTNRAAIQKLLAGTGLVYTFTAENAVAVKPAPKQLNKAEPTTLAPMTVVGEREYDATDPYNPDYVQPDATTGTKTDTPIMQTPLNVQVITKQVMNDQQVIRLDQALRNISGVTMTKNSNGGLNEEFNLRGFNDQTQFRNGIRFDFGNNAGTRQMANVESIEVLKGPAAILYGRVEPGGMVNIITKQPLATPYYSLDQQFGSFDLYRTSIDATGPLTKDDTLLYRMNMSYENSGSWRDLVDSEQFFFAPTLKWNISPQTQATLEVEFKHGHTGLDFQNLPFVDNEFIELPRNQNLAERSPSNTDDILVALNWSHQFNDAWSVKHQILSRQISVNQDQTFLQNFDLENNVAERSRYLSKADNDLFATVLDLTGHFDTLGLKHTLLAGGDYYRLDYNNYFTQQGGFDADFNFVDPSRIDIFHPVHPGMPPINQLPLLNSGDFTQISDNYGLYAQDQIQLPYNVHVMGGLRYQYVHQNLTSNGSNDFNLPPSSDASTDDAVTPRVGILWQPQSWLSVYSNYVENFGANSGRGFNAKPLPPQSAQQWEVGVKTEFFGGRLRATLDYYDLTKQNVATTDRDPTHECNGGGFGSCQIAVGEVRSRGPELDIQGEILPGWNVIASYANLDVRVTKDNSGLEGLRLQFVPRNTGSLWSTYDFQAGALSGFRIGGGVTLRDSVTDFDNLIDSTGYVTVDMMAGYSFEVGKSKVTAQLNINNLLDKTYFTDATASGNVGFVNYSTPRSFMGSINIQY